MFKPPVQKVLLTGFGFMGEIHAQAYTHIPEAEIIGIVESNEKDAREKAARLGVRAPIFSNLEAAIRETKPNIVDVCLPTPMHADAAICAAEQGSHVFCEKPLALTVQDAERVQKAVTQSGVFCQVGHCIRFWPEYQALESLIRKKELGGVLSLSMYRRAARPKYSHGDWLNDPRKSLGAALDLHIHDTDYALHLFGKPSSVHSIGTRDASGWSHLFTHYHYEDKAVVAEGGWNFPKEFGLHMGFQAVFEHGEAEFDSRANPSLTIIRKEGAREPLAIHTESIEAGEVSGNISSLGGYLNELQYFVNCVSRNEAPQVATLAQATDSLKVVLAEIASAETGNKVAIGAC